MATTFYPTHYTTATDTTYTTPPLYTYGTYTTSSYVWHDSLKEKYASEQIIKLSDITDMQKEILILKKQVSLLCKRVKELES